MPHTSYCQQWLGSNCNYFINCLLYLILKSYCSVGGYSGSLDRALASRWQIEMVQSRVSKASPKMLKISKVNAIILPQPKPLRQYQWSNFDMTVTRYTFSVVLKEIKTISQTLPSTCVICLQPRQSGHHRGELEAPCEFSNTNLEIFSQDVWHTRQAPTKWRIKVPKANPR